MNISSTEIMVVLLVALIVLGPQRLPGAMKQAGKAYRDFKKVSNSVQREINQVVNDTTSMLTDTADTFTGKSPATPSDTSNAVYRPADEVPETSTSEPTGTVNTPADELISAPADEVDPAPSDEPTS